MQSITCAFWCACTFPHITQFFKLPRFAVYAADLAAPNKELQSIRTLEGYYKVTPECLISRMESLCTQLRVHFGAHAHFLT